ncbi:hypothetical protein WDA76_02580, partial [Acinetobacter nosocomialis]|uniref:hypothetical protein n=1 Tax=Acinetobacter nosocomialis TaxID=106654 RepID=UPI001C07410F
LLALMVVWGYPCESKSSPAHYSKHPNLKRGRGVFIARNKKILENSVPKKTNLHSYSILEI